LTHDIQGHTYEQNGKKYFYVDIYKVEIIPQRVHFQFDNILRNSELSTEINTILNDNWQSVYADVRPGYEESFGTLFKMLANNLFSRVAYDDIFLS